MSKQTEIPCAVLDGDALRLVRADRLERLVRDLSAMGEKVSGSAEEAQACDYLCRDLASHGVAHEVLRFDSYISHPTLTRLNVSGVAIEAVGVAFAGDTGDQGVQVSLVYAGDGSPAAYRGLDVRGKAVLIDRIPEYGVCAAAQAAGAVALIGASHGPQRHKMTCSPVWGAPATPQELAQMPGIAVASINRPDADALMLRLQAGPLIAHLVARIETQWREVRLPVADIPGEEPEFLLIGAHYCTWFDGATDNIAANALLLELARILQSSGRKPRYGVRLAWWPGHTHGRYSGSAWYADQYWQELHDRAIAYFNVDIVGSVGAINKCARNQTAEIGAYAQRMIDAVCGPTSEADRQDMARCLHRPERYVDKSRPHRGSDQSFWGVGLTALQVSSFLRQDDANRLPGSGLAWWWHTAQDRPDTCDPQVLAVDTALHLRMVQGLVDAPQLPMDLHAITADFQAALREYQEQATGLDIWGALADRVHEFDLAVAGFQAETTCDRDTALVRDRCLLRVLRSVNPVLYQVSDPYGQDPARPSRLLPGLRPALGFDALEPDARHMAAVALRRQANRIHHCLAQAMQCLHQGISAAAGAAHG